MKIRRSAQKRHLRMAQNIDAGPLSKSWLLISKWLNNTKYCGAVMKIRFFKWKWLILKKKKRFLDSLGIASQKELDHWSYRRYCKKYEQYLIYGIRYVMWNTNKAQLEIFWNRFWTFLFVQILHSIRCIVQVPNRLFFRRFLDQVC